MESKSSSSTMVNISSGSSETLVSVKSKSSSKSTNTNLLSDYVTDLSLDDSSSSSSSFYLVDAPYDLAALEAEAAENESAMSSRLNTEPLRDASGRPYPPPISCMKMFKTGKPYTYISVSKDDDSFVVEEIRIPNRDMFRAARSDGRLKLYFDTSDDN